MMRARFRHAGLLGVALIIACAAIISCIGIVSDGLHHVETASMFRLAGEDLQNGNISNGVHKLLIAIGMTMEGGARSQIAKAYLRQSHALYQQGQLPEALNTCIEAVHALGAYDDEGMISYNCDVIQYQIQHPLQGSQP